MKKLLSTFTIFDLVLCGFMAALGIAIKPFIMPLVYFISTPLLIPGGSLAGGFYMLWIVLGAVAVNRPFACGIIGLIQAIIVITTGTVGSHGILSIVIYILPALAVDMILFFFQNVKDKKMAMFFGCMTANVSGLLLTNIFIYHLPLITLITSLTIGAISGGIGGLISYAIFRKLIKLNILKPGGNGYETIK